jgi:hypothetical protein
MLCVLLSFCNLMQRSLYEKNKNAEEKVSIYLTYIDIFDVYVLRYRHVSDRKRNTVLDFCSLFGLVCEVVPEWEISPPSA